MSDGAYALAGGRVVLPDRVIAAGSVVIEDGLIVSVLEAAERLPPSLRRVELEGAWLTPGLVELHIHGCGGIGFDALGAGHEVAAAALRRARDFLRSRGVTCFLPTLICRDAELDALAAALELAGFPESEVPGIYLEGPFINEKRRGGIPSDTILEPSPEDLARVLALGRGRIRLMTLAPELDGAGALMSSLAAAGILPCLGHSDANIELSPLPVGDFSITHLFNAMSPFSHKEAGLAMLPFVDRKPFVELNADGVHVGEAALRACAGALDADRLILISDAVVAAGLPLGDYGYYGMRIVSGPDGVRYAEGGVLMGSNRLAPQVLHNWLKVTGASVPASVRALSLNPARALGLAERRGSIEAGKMAELVAWNGDFESVREIYG